MLRLRRRADLSIASRISLEEERRRSCFDAVRRDGNDRNFELVVGEFEMIPERAIRLELNGPAGNSDLGLRIRSAVENNLRIHVHEETAHRPAKWLRAPAC